MQPLYLPELPFSSMGGALISNSGQLTGMLLTLLGTKDFNDIHRQMGCMSPVPLMQRVQHTHYFTAKEKRDHQKQHLGQAYKEENKSSQADFWQSCLRASEQAATVLFHDCQCMAWISLIRLQQSEPPPPPLLPPGEGSPQQLPPWQITKVCV